MIARCQTDAVMSEAGTADLCVAACIAQLAGLGDAQVDVKRWMPDGDPAQHDCARRATSQGAGDSGLKWVRGTVRQYDNSDMQTWSGVAKLGTVATASERTSQGRQRQRVFEVGGR